MPGQRVNNRFIVFFFFYFYYFVVFDFIVRNAARDKSQMFVPSCENIDTIINYTCVSPRTESFHLRSDITRV